MSSKFFDLSGAGKFIDTMIRLFELGFKECKIFHDCGTVPDITLSHTLLLNWIFGSLDMLQNFVLFINGESIFFKNIDQEIAAILPINNHFLVITSR